MNEHINKDMPLATMYELLTVEERNDFDSLFDESKAVEAKILQYYLESGSISESELDDLRIQDIDINNKMEDYINTALSRLTTEKDHQHNFHDDLMEAILQSFSDKNRLSLQMASAVAAYYCDKHPEQIDLYKTRENETFSEYVKRIEKALLEADPDRISVNVNRADKVEYPVDKVNRKIWQILEGTPQNQIGFSSFDIIAGEKRGKQAVVTYSINFDGLPDNVSITKKLTPFDKRVYIAVSALYNAGNTVISLSQIAYAMGYASTPAKNQLQKIQDSITKMNVAQIQINNSKEIAIFKGYKEFEYQASLLPMEMLRATVNGKTTEAAIRLFREPPMITYAKQHKQITTIEVKLLQSPLSKTPTNLCIEDYLLEQIAFIKNPKNKITNRMLFDTIFEQAGITDKKQRQRTPEKIKALLEYYKQEKWIKDYKIDKAGIDIFY